MVATVRQEINELVIASEEDSLSIVLGPGDEVPDWALEICSNPRLIDGLDEDEET